ncbi:MAG: SCP2 sterol-binding domain-containing protein [Candidatus Lokiarchaeota archaeon]|nr:SCP2 sterol-binding domain-containing protein [Candidatus Lokiarchaeota archaeon]
MVDEALKEKLAEKVDEGSLTPADIPDYMNLFVQICNENEEVQEEVEGWDRIFQFSIDGAANLWMKISGGKFETGPGDTAEPDVTLEFDSDTAVGIFSGEIDATQAYMNNELKVIGPLPDAVKFRTLTELVRDELEE